MKNSKKATYGNLRHGMCYTPEYRAWRLLQRRCYEPTNPKFPGYGGRGITVCDRWRISFEAFYADLGPRPSPQHSVDRRDNDGPYSPENCRWATRKEQARNRRTTALLTFRGETLSIAAWAERFGLRYQIVYYRLFRDGWPIERALTEQPRRSRLGIAHRRRA